MSIAVSKDKLVTRFKVNLLFSLELLKELILKLEIL